MTTKRTHGQCTVGHAWGEHTPDCPSLYHAQQEPDALTRLARLIRQMQEEQLQRRADALAEQALSLISEAREEHRKARGAGLERAAHEAEVSGFNVLAEQIRALKVGQ